MRCAHLKYLNEVRVKRSWYRNSAYCLQYWNLQYQWAWPPKISCCNSTYRLRYWNSAINTAIVMLSFGCNSTYRLRYAPQSVRQQKSKATMRPTHCKYLNEVKVKRKWSGNGAYRLRYWNLCIHLRHIKAIFHVATALTVYGIET